MLEELPKDWRAVKLSKNFTIGECYRSKGHPKLGGEMYPIGEEVDDLIVLFQTIVQPIRDHYGPTIVTSGVRHSALNKAVGGAINSQHCRGKAVDIKCLKVRDMMVVYQWITHDRKWPGECFYYTVRGHVHVGLPEFGVKADHAILNK